MSTAEDGVEKEHALKGKDEKKDKEEAAPAGETETDVTKKGDLVAADEETDIVLESAKKTTKKVTALAKVAAPKANKHIKSTKRKKKGNHAIVPITPPELALQPWEVDADRSVYDNFIKKHGFDTQQTDFDLHPTRRITLRACVREDKCEQYMKKQAGKKWTLHKDYYKSLYNAFTTEEVKEVQIECSDDKLEANEKLLELVDLVIKTHPPVRGPLQIFLDTETEANELDHIGLSKMLEIINYETNSDNLCVAYQTLEFIVQNNHDVANPHVTSAYRKVYDDVLLVHATAKKKSLQSTNDWLDENLDLCRLALQASYEDLVGVAACDTEIKDVRKQMQTCYDESELCKLLFGQILAGLETGDLSNSIDSEISTLDDKELTKPSINEVRLKCRELVKQATNVEELTPQRNVDFTFLDVPHTSTVDSYDMEIEHKLTLYKITRCLDLKLVDAPFADMSFAKVARDWRGANDAKPVHAVLVKPVKKAFKSMCDLFRNNSLKTATTIATSLKQNHGTLMLEDHTIQPYIDFWVALADTAGLQLLHEAILRCFPTPLRLTPVELVIKKLKQLQSEAFLDYYAPDDKRELQLCLEMALDVQAGKAPRLDSLAETQFLIRLKERLPLCVQATDENGAEQYGVDALEVMVKEIKGQLDENKDPLTKKQMAPFKAFKWMMPEEMVKLTDEWHKLVATSLNNQGDAAMQARGTKRLREKEKEKERKIQKRAEQRPRGIESQQATALRLFANNASVKKEPTEKQQEEMTDMDNEHKKHSKQKKS